ncbi:MAG: metalloregulator ArsR/SmtB family transcription factor [Amaricoccus sp.]
MQLPANLSDTMADKAETVAGFLKGLANPQRLLVLCCLMEGERNVGALIAATGIAQTSMSQHLAKLREEGIVAVRRDHRSLYYRIDHPAVLELMQTLYRAFCLDQTPGPGAR